VNLESGLGVIEVIGNGTIRVRVPIRRPL